LKQFYSVVIL